MRLLVAAVLTSACSAPAHNLFPAGSTNDDGHGALAQASARFMRHEHDDDDDDFFSRSRRHDDDDEFGGAAYGGVGYGTFVVPSWQPQAASRVPKYTQVPGLVGAIEGTVTWKGALPQPRDTPCGPLDLARVGPDRGIADVIVYIERVQSGRVLGGGDRPVSVGGVVVKRGCALVPTAQIVTPLPAALAIHGDARRARLIVTTAENTPRAIDLEEGGRATMQAQLGVTRIDGEDGGLASAWVLALDTPYYAITDDRGRFRIDELAPGNYEVTFWRAPQPIGPGALTYGPPVVVRRSIRVVAQNPARLDVTLDR
jgi:hypothetical protein